MSKSWKQKSKHFIFRYAQPLKRKSATRNVTEIRRPRNVKLKSWRQNAASLPPRVGVGMGGGLGRAAREPAGVRAELGNTARPPLSAGLGTGRNSVLSSYASTICSVPFCGRIKLLSFLPLEYRQTSSNTAVVTSLHLSRRGAERH